MARMSKEDLFNLHKQNIIEIARKHGVTIEDKVVEEIVEYLTLRIAQVIKKERRGRERYERRGKEVLV